jgi:hypothetical protein
MHFIFEKFPSPRRGLDHETSTVWREATCQVTAAPIPRSARSTQRGTERRRIDPLKPTHSIPIEPHLRLSGTARSRRKEVR